jgi:hypothetical protein
MAAAVVIASLLIAAFAMPRNRTAPAAPETRQESRRAIHVLLGLGLFFWAFVTVAVLSIFAAYLL